MLFNMAHIFLCDDVQKLLNNKFVVVLGSSVQRSVYKDLVMLLQKNKYMTDRQLRSKGELTFEKDELIAGGVKGEMTNGVNFREVREYKTDHHWIKYYFITRCYNAYVETILKELAKDPQPDVLILNSCLWDVTRYGRGAASVAEFRKNIIKLCSRLKEILPNSCTVLWNSAMPVSKDAKGGVLVPEADFLRSTVSIEILEANFLTCSHIVEFGFDVIDIHYHLQNQIHRRAEDGVHWDMTAHRRISNLILTHLSEAWNVPLPSNIKQLFAQSKLSPTGKLSPTENMFATKKVSPVQNISGKVLHQVHVKNVMAQKKSPASVKKVTAQKKSPGSVKNITAQKKSPAFVKNVTAQKKSPAFVKNVTAQKKSPAFVKNVTAQKKNPASVKNVTAQKKNPASVKNVTAQKKSPASVKNVTDQKKSPAFGKGKKKGKRKRKLNVANSASCQNQELFQHGPTHTNIQGTPVMFNRVSSALEHTNNFLSSLQNSDLQLGTGCSNGSGYDQNKFEALYGGPVRRTNYFENAWQPYEDRSYVHCRPISRVNPRFTPYGPFY